MRGTCGGSELISQFGFDSNRLETRCKVGDDYFFASNRSVLSFGIITLFVLIIALRDSRNSVVGTRLQETYSPEVLEDLFNPPTTLELERSIAERLSQPFDAHAYASRKYDEDGWSGLGVLVNFICNYPQNLH